jgi:NAD(P)H-nitrite reductase large subunit
MGGEYITWFREEGSKERRLLYKLENLGIVKLDRKIEFIDKKKSYHYKWILTSAGKKLVDENESLKEMWKNGAHNVDVVKFYNAVIEILGI